jgi:CheY-like chemotaxis protein
MSSGSADSPRKTVLVVEDDADIRDMLVMLLEFDGYRAAAVNDGLQALDWLSREDEPALVLLDLMMPNLDGLGFLERWRALTASGRCPVVILSGAGMRGPVNGAQCVLQKPVDAAELLQVVERFARGA